MEYFKLIAGIILTATFTWLLVKNWQRKSFVNALLRVDTILGLIAGIYLIVASGFSLFVH